MPQNLDQAVALLGALVGDPNLLLGLQAFALVVLIPFVIVAALLRVTHR